MELIDYGARWYDPQIGRFISPDTIIPDYTNPQSLNRFSYVLGNPLKFTDPTGHCAEYGDDACWSEYERIKFIDKCQDCETIVTGDGIVPLHEANYDRLRSYRENRIVNPVDYPEMELPNGTVSLNATATGILPGLEGHVSAGMVHFDEEGNFMVGTFSVGGGGTTNVLGTSAGVSVMATNGDNLSVLAGKTVYTTVAAEAVIGSASATGMLMEGGVAEGIALNADLGARAPFFVPASLTGGAEHTFDRAIFSSRITSDGRDICFFCSFSQFFGSNP